MLNILVNLSLQGNEENAREAFDAFLERYPYCYGYWKKYADLEKKTDDPSKVEQVCVSWLYHLCLLAVLFQIEHMEEQMFERCKSKDDFGKVHQPPCCFCMFPSTDC